MISAPAEPQEHRIELAAGPEAALAAVDQAADLWGAELRRIGPKGEIRLPVRAGIRRGVVTAGLAVAPAAAGSRVELRVTGTEHSVQLEAVAILLMAAAGGLVTALWPFIPSLLPLAPFGAIVALSGWFLVVSRLRSSGPEDFLETVSRVAADPGIAGPPDAL